MKAKKGPKGSLIELDRLMPTAQDVQLATRFKERHPSWPWDIDFVAKLLTLHRIDANFMVPDDVIAETRKIQSDLGTNKECRELAERNFNAVIDEITRVEGKLKSTIN